MSNTQVKERTMKKEETYWTQDEISSLPSKYGCILIKERATIEEQKNKQLPLDVYRIFYKLEDKVHCDLVRTSKRVNLFDMYYDKFGSGVVQNIDFGYGTINPKLWGYTQAEPKKKRR